MKFSELIPLKEGVFLLEEGDGQWPPNQCETVVIQFAGSETELAAQRFEDDDEVFLPSSLEDRHLRTVEVHHEGWYADTALEQVGELAPAIFDFLPDMLIGQKVMIMDVHGREREGMVYVVKLMSVHAEARTELSPHEQILFDAVRELQPHTEADWSKVNAKWTRDVWRKVMNSSIGMSEIDSFQIIRRFENAQQSSSTSVQLLETPDLVTDQTATGDSGSTQFISDSTNHLQPKIGEEERKKRVEPEDIIQFQNLSIEVPLSEQAPTYSMRHEEQAIRSKENSKRERKRWSSIYGL